MRKLIIILSIALLPFCIKAQTANAGSDVTIYLTETSSATLDGSASSGTSYQWREISTDYSSAGTITNATSKTATVSGVQKGTFYFEIAATTGGTTKRDTMVVRVRASRPPSNFTVVKDFDMSNSSIYTPINDRSDTVTYYPTGTSQSSAGVDPNRYYLFRDRMPNMTIDVQRGKLLNQNVDGYAGMNAGGGLGNYPRTELETCDACFVFDTTKTYMFEWTGYFPQNVNWMKVDGDPDWANILVIWQIHGTSSHYDYAIANFELYQNDTLYFRNEITGTQAETGDTYQIEKVALGTLNDFYNKSHTFRITMREGLGPESFIKLEVDGVQKYYRQSRVGSAFFDDYPKFGSIYDWRSWMTDGDSLSRGRRWGLVTESFKIYQQTSVAVAAPTISMSGPQAITATFTSIYAVPSWAAGHTGTVAWTKVSGPGATTFTAPASTSTGVTGLLAGDYVFRCTATQDDGQTVTGDVAVHVTILQPQNISLTTSGSAKIFISTK